MRGGRVVPAVLKHAVQLEEHRNRLVDFPLSGAATLLDDLHRQRTECQYDDCARGAVQHGALELRSIVVDELGEPKVQAQVEMGVSVLLRDAKTPELERKYLLR